MVLGGSYLRSSPFFTCAKRLKLYLYLLMYAARLTGCPSYLRWLFLFPLWCEVLPNKLFFPNLCYHSMVVGTSSSVDSFMVCTGQNNESQAILQYYSSGVSLSS